MYTYGDTRRRNSGEKERNFVVKANRRDRIGTRVAGRTRTAETVLNGFRDQSSYVLSCRYYR